MSVRGIAQPINESIDILRRACDFPRKEFIPAVRLSPQPGPAPLRDLAARPMRSTEDEVALSDLAVFRGVRAISSPSLPAGCTLFFNASAPGSDDDVDDDDGRQYPPKTLGWNTSPASVHCSHAGLTAVPTLPTAAEFMYACSQGTLNLITLADIWDTTT